MVSLHIYARLKTYNRPRSHRLTQAYEGENQYQDQHDGKLTIYISTQDKITYNRSHRRRIAAPAVAETPAAAAAVPAVAGLAPAVAAPPAAGPRHCRCRRSRHHLS